MRPKPRLSLSALGLAALLPGCLQDSDRSPEFDLAGAVANHPDSLRHWSGAWSRRDGSRLLLAFARSQTLEAVRGRLESGPLEVEPNPQGAAGEEAVLHTEREIWVRSRSGKPLTSAVLRAIGAGLGGELAWAGGVYKVPRSGDSALSPLDSLGRLYGAWPHLLRVGLTAAYQDNDRRGEVEKILARHFLSLPKEAVLTETLECLWAGAPEGNVYLLRDSLPAMEPRAVSSAALVNAPLLSPQTGASY